MSTFVLNNEYGMSSYLGFLKSKIRREIFSLFFTNPEQKYYLRQLERLLGFSAGNIRRELLNLVQDGLFHTEKQGNLFYYSLNTDHALYEEIKSIVFKTIGVEGSLRDCLSNLKNIKTAFIYGSFASQSEKKSRDIDVMIIGDPEISELNRRIRELEHKMSREIHVTIYSLAEYETKKKDKRRFILDLLKSPKIILIGRENDL